jgi:hypothetical protein
MNKNAITRSFIVLITCTLTGAGLKDPIWTFIYDAKAKTAKKNHK